VFSPERAGGVQADRAIPDGEVVELDLLLPGWQVAALEGVAHRQGVTTGQLARQVLVDFLRRTSADRTPRIEGGV
jgi:hypothetical protein